STEIRRRSGVHRACADSRRRASSSAAARAALRLLARREASRLANSLNVAYIRARGVAVWLHALAGVAVQIFLISTITLLIVRWTLGTPLQKMARWLRDLRTGKVTAYSE